MESLDIDDPKDWWIAKKFLTMKNIIIRVDGYRKIGLGHIYRCITLANSLIEHNVLFILSSKSKLGINKIRYTNFKYKVIDHEDDIIEIINEFKCDIIINDILDTSLNYMKKIRNMNLRICNFEDLGEGSKLADIVINDLYEKKNNLDNFFWGSKYYFLRDEFLYTQSNDINKEVKNILITFGGTDPLNLTKKTYDIVKKNNNEKINYNFLLGMGYFDFDGIEEDSRKHKNINIFKDVKFVSKLMKKNDLAISSQGRTMYELASLNIPSILIAQNERELNHEFGYERNGFINLGLGSNLKDSQLLENLEFLITNYEKRKEMINKLKKTDLKNNINRVIKLILNENSPI